MAYDKELSRASLTNLHKGNPLTESYTNALDRILVDDIFVTSYGEHHDTQLLEKI